LFKEKVQIWKHQTFGDIMGKKRKILDRIQGIEKSNHYPYSIFLQNLHTNLKKEYNDLLLIEEDYWKLRSEFYGSMRVMQILIFSTSQPLIGKEEIK